ncbi:MAG TPA: hypothetical protein VHR45_15740 [Thermoanaerobaculia bacterium]|nr:hypothetical protein [Thermoanaerobaculia bacterium]
MAFVATALLVPAAVLCGGAAGAAAGTSGADLPAPNANALWTYISQQNPYTSWQYFPGNDKMPIHLIEEPHGEWVSVYANEIAVRSMTNPLNPFTMQYGSILVKENYPASAAPPPDRKTMMSLTVMYKVNGYHTLPGEEEWFWTMLTPGGAVAVVSTQPWASQPAFKIYKGEVQAGKPWFCVGCHQAAAQSSKEAVGDYVWKLKPFGANSK